MWVNLAWAAGTSIGTASSRELRGIGLPVIASQRWNSEMKMFLQKKHCRLVVSAYPKIPQIRWGKPPIFSHQLRQYTGQNNSKGAGVVTMTHMFYAWKWEPLVPTSFGIDSLGALLKQHRRAKPRGKKNIYIATCHATIYLCINHILQLHVCIYMYSIDKHMIYKKTPKDGLNRMPDPLAEPF